MPSTAARCRAGPRPPRAHRCRSRTQAPRSGRSARASSAGTARRSSRSRTCAAIRTTSSNPGSIPPIIAVTPAAGASSSAANALACTSRESVALAPERGERLHRDRPVMPAAQMAELVREREPLTHRRVRPVDPQHDALAIPPTAAGNPLRQRRDDDRQTEFALDRVSTQSSGAADRAQAPPASRARAWRRCWCPCRPRNQLCTMQDRCHGQSLSWRWAPATSDASRCRPLSIHWRRSRPETLQKAAPSHPPEPISGTGFRPAPAVDCPVRGRWWDPASDATLLQTTYRPGTLPPGGHG